MSLALQILAAALRQVLAAPRWCRNPVYCGPWTWRYVEPDFTSSGMKPFAGKPCILCTDRGRPDRLLDAVVGLLAARSYNLSITPSMGVP